MYSLNKLHKIVYSIRAVVGKKIAFPHNIKRISFDATNFSYNIPQIDVKDNIENTLSVNNTNMFLKMR